MSAGKGDTYRPVNWQAYGENYDTIFRKRDHEQAPEQTPEVVCPICGRVNCDIGPYPWPDAYPRQAGRETGVDDAAQAAAGDEANRPGPRPEDVRGEGVDRQQ